MGLIGTQTVSGDAIYVSEVSTITGSLSGVTNRYAGVVANPEETVSVELENGRAVKEVQVKTGDQVKKECSSCCLSMILAVSSRVWNKHSWIWID